MTPETLPMAYVFERRLSFLRQGAESRADVAPRLWRGPVLLFQAVCFPMTGRGVFLLVTYVPMLVLPRSLGSPSVSAVISLMKPCVQIPGARPCWSPLMLASC